MRLKRNAREAGEPDQLAGVAQFDREESEAMLRRVRLNAKDHRVALLRRKGRGKELHHARIGIDPAERFAVALLPRAQSQSGRFQQLFQFTREGSAGTGWHIKI